MGGVVLLTGAAGFLGTEIARRLLEEPTVRVVALVLVSGDDEARAALGRAWSYAPELEEALAQGRVEAVAGDVRRGGLGLGPAVHRDLARRVSHIIHAAADLRIDTAPDELRPTNVEGVANVLAFASACHADHGLARLSHVSTAYVAGGRTGEVPEDALDDRFGFENAYELTKFEGERLVRAAMARLPIAVFRPAMIVGDSRTGEVRTFNTFYLRLRRYLTGHLRVAPASPRLRVNIVPVDHVADAIVRLTFEPAAEGTTFHLTAPAEELPSAAELMRFARHWARERLGLRLSRVVFVPLPALRRTAVSPDELERRGRPRSGSAVDALRPYLRERRRFRRDNTERLLGPYPLRWRAFLPALLEHAVARGFLHRSARTVHEQALFRLTGRSLPVRYVDLLGDRAEARSGPEMRDNVLAAAAALHARGVGPGTRVAMIGPNGTRYLTIDLAIGLVGQRPAVPQQPDGRRRAHPARQRGRAAVRRLRRRAPPPRTPCVEAAVRLLRAQLRADRRRGCDVGRVPARRPGGCARAHLPRALGRRRHAALHVRHHGPAEGRRVHPPPLRWMAETMATLIPWTTRTRPGSYLSFLPMNHVVEGILGTYSPYWMPAPVEIVFLEDFAGLPRALRTVRPMVFFAVPRIYEKCLEAARTSRAGRRFLAMPEGQPKRRLRPLVRRRLLRRAGLDRCALLMVGSAAVGEALPRTFRDLGIEIHDAFGLTEAPLVTMNRPGRNRVGTAGEPLPETHIRVADDGEVLVRGPQVMVGYADEGAAQPFEDGWLLTGDLGHLTTDGYLVIEGRKKDLLKTAYGKYLNPSRIEARLRAIPDVAEAMIVGEGRPFCAALVWADGPLTPARIAGIDEAIGQVNQGLARPEQVRRWAVLANDLSVADGDLTPNLKLRRTRVAERCRATIEDLYATRDASAPEAVMPS